MDWRNWLDLPLIPPWTVYVNCSAPESYSDKTRFNYACGANQKVRLGSTIVHLLYILLVMVATGLIYLCFRLVQDRKASRALVNSAVSATGAARSKERATFAVSSATAVAPNMLLVAAQVAQQKRL
jgi:hypothetical protein